MPKTKNIFLLRVTVVLATIVVFLSLFSNIVSAADAYDSNKPDNLTADYLACKSAILIEADSGNVIFENNADTIMYPASTTKILTVLLGIMLGDSGQTVTTGATALMIPEDASKIPLAEGEKINFQDLLYATMVKSGNDGANLIAESISGDNASFVALMNDAASAMGCTNTHFSNPSGLHDESHYTTARDMAILSREAMKNELFRKMASATEYTLPKSNIYRARTLVSGHNEFLKSGSNTNRYYQYATGIKTGFHDAAGYCYVGSAIKEGVSLISVVFNTTSSGRWSDTKKLMEFGFSQYISVTPEDIYNMNPKTIDISSFALDDTNLGRLQLSIRKISQTANDNIVIFKEQIEYITQNFNSLVAIEYTRNFTAPIEASEVMGILSYYSEKGEPVKYELVATRSIAKRESIAPTIAEIVEYTTADPNPFPRFSYELMLFAVSPAIALCVVFFVFKKLLSRKRKRKTKPIHPIGRYYR